VRRRAPDGRRVGHGGCRPFQPDWHHGSEWRVADRPSAGYVCPVQFVPAGRHRRPGRAVKAGTLGRAPAGLVRSVSVSCKL
jgi:hypothetical protein